MVVPWSERYFRPKPFELGGRPYEMMGVLLFKRMLMSLVSVEPGKRTTNAYVLGSHSLEAVREFERRSRRSEVHHLIGLVLAVVFLGLGAFASGLLVASGVVFAANFHCFLLQRYNRIRVYRLLERAHARARATTDPA